MNDGCEISCGAEARKTKRPMWGALMILHDVRVRAWSDIGRFLKMRQGWK